MNLASSCGSGELLERNNKEVIYMCFVVAAAAELRTVRAVVGDRAFVICCSKSVAEENREDQADCDD